MSYNETPYDSPLPFSMYLCYHVNTALIKSTNSKTAKQSKMPEVIRHSAISGIVDFDWLSHSLYLRKHTNKNEQEVNYYLIYSIHTRHNNERDLYLLTIVRTLEYKACMLASISLASVSYQISTYLMLLMM